MADMPNIDPRLLGRRLADARKARGKTQEEAAANLGCSRPTLIAIEKGERLAKAGEIIKLAEFYGRSVHELVRPGVPVTTLEPHLRAVAESSEQNQQELNAAVAELQRLAENYCELEKLLSARLFQNYPPEVRVLPRGVVEFAQDVAMLERARLGLGDQPVLNLRQVLENDVGLRVFYGVLPSNVAGMYAYAADLGYCVLINKKHPPERRRATLAHEYGHFLCDRHKPGIDYLDGSRRRPQNEKFAEFFGLSFLMPTIGVRRQYHEIVATRNDFQVADLCRLSNYYFVSVQAMTLRLEELGLIPRGIWNLLREERFKVRKAQHDLGLTYKHLEPDEPYPERYKFLAVQAYEVGLVSEGQLARFLRCDRVRAREIVADCLNQSFVDERNGETTSGQLSFDFSLLRKANVDRP